MQSEDFTLDMHQISEKSRRSLAVGTSMVLLGFMDACFRSNAYFNLKSRARTQVPEKDKAARNWQD